MLMESIDPVRDKEIIDIELQLKDLESSRKKITSISRIIKSGDKDALKKMNWHLKIKEALEQSVSVRAFGFFG